MAACKGLRTVPAEVEETIVDGTVDAQIPKDVQCCPLSVHRTSYLVSLGLPLLELVHSFHTFVKTQGEKNLKVLAFGKLKDCFPKTQVFLKF